jgi:hypothetical protein
MNLHRTISKLVGYKIDPEELNAYRSVIPDTLNVNVKEQDGHFIIQVNTIEGKKIDDLLITEALGENNVVDMVNDLVLTYKRVPEEYRPYFKQILKPEGSSPTKSEALTLVKA